MPVVTEKLFLSSRQSSRLDVLDVEEATGAPRLTVAEAFGSESHTGLLCAGDPVNWVDPFGLHEEPPPYQYEDRGTATLDRITIFGTGVETAETAGFGPRGPGGPLDFSPNDRGGFDAGDAGGGGGSGSGPALQPSPFTPPNPTIPPNPFTPPPVSPVPPNPAPPSPVPPNPVPPNPTPYNWGPAKEYAIDMMFTGGLFAGAGGVMTFVPGLQFPGVVIGGSGAVVGLGGVLLYIGATNEERLQGGGR